MKAQLALFSTPIKAGKFTPRPYQVRADLAIAREHETHRSTLVVHPTGAGKTVLFCLQALKHGGALVLVHRDTLMQQARAKLSAATGKDVAIEKAAVTAFESPYVVASVQSLHKDRLAAFKRRFESFPLIIVDEAHRATAKSYRQILDAYPDSKVLGVTATPDRSDGIAMKNVFETVADEYSLIDCTADGWLTPLRFQPVTANVNLDGIKLVGQGYDRDFDQVELDNAIVQEAGRIAQSVYHAMERCDNPNGRLVVFCPGVKTAHAGASAMNELRAGCATVVDGEMDDRFKRRVIERFSAGEFQYIFNCNVLTEGFDDPGLYGVFDCSPSASRLRVVQRWGRTTRLVSDSIGLLPTAEERRAAIAASVKPWATIFDLALNSSQHDVVIDPVSILAGKDLPKEVTALARTILKRDGGTVGDAVARAEEETRTKARKARAAKHLAAATKVTLGKARSVFDRAGIEFIRRTKMAKRPEEKASDKMLWLMRKRGIPIPPDCSLSMFRRLLGLDEKKEKAGLCRLGGVEWLSRYGVDAWKMPSATAIRIRDAIRAKGRKLTPEEIAPLMERTPGED